MSRSIAQGELWRLLEYHVSVCSEGLLIFSVCTLFSPCLTAIDYYFSNGGLECPAHPNSYHADAIVTRLRYYCIAATVIGVKRLLSFDGCDGLAQKFEDCNLVRLGCQTTVKLNTMLV